MNTVKVKDVVIGEGVPKICVPIVAKTKNEIIEEALDFKNINVDMVEWRVDFFEDALDDERVKAVLEELVPALKNVPMIFTFRTSKEGGEKVIDTLKYIQLNKAVIDTGLVDIIDVEAFTGDNFVMEAIEYAHAAGVKVIASNHDFEKTPSKEEIISRLRKMQDLGADIPKIAVMPKSKLDVLELLEATAIMSEEYADRPIVTMAMSGIGVVSRLTGEVFGSAITFGAANRASAPGQIDVERLYNLLQLLHKSID